MPKRGLIQHKQSEGEVRAESGLKTGFTMLPQNGEGRQTNEEMDGQASSYSAPTRGTGR